MSSPVATLALASYASLIAARLGALATAPSPAPPAAATPPTPPLPTPPAAGAAPLQSGGIILSAIPPPNAALPAAPNGSRMDLNLTNLLTGSASSDGSRPLQSTQALPPELLKPQVIEALVLKSTLLPAGNTQKGATAAPAPTQPQLPAQTPAQQPQVQAQAKVELAWQGRVLQLLSSQPLPVGSQVRIEVNARGELKLLPPQLTGTAPNTPANAPPTRTAEPALPPPLQQSLRENLPRQRPLADLQPLLQRLLSPTQLPKLPAPVAAALRQLATSLPKPQQLQSADGVRQAVARSGNFLEARVMPAATRPLAPALAQPAATATGAAPVATRTAPIDATAPRPGLPVDAAALQAVQATADAAADGDLKAQLLQLIALIRRFTPATPASAPETLPDQPYTRPQPKQAPVARPNGGERELEQLQQLSRLLQGGLARIQVNQLDGAVSRVASGNDGQPPAPSWSFELPIQTPRGGDTLQLRIEQQARQSDGVRQMQWKVQLAFDLHELGKLAATLTVTGANVAATLWAEQRHTHGVVRAEIDHFRAALEGVGVRVTELQCRLGLPPEQQHRWQQQLVDVRT